jgi:hypothetical protein
MLYVTSSQRSCGDAAEDGWVDTICCIELFYPNFIIFIVLAPNDNLIFLLGL